MLTLLIVIAVVITLIPLALGIFTGEGVFIALGAFCALVIGWVAALLPYSYAATHNDREIVCTVTDKDRGGDEGSYRIYTEECGQLANADSVWRGKYDSADVWQDIQPGHTYRMTVVGYRIPFMSEFPNVLSVEPVA